MIARPKGTARRVIKAVALVTAGLAFPATAQFYERATAYRTPTPIQIDGQLDEVSWTLVAPLGPFRDIESGEAVTATTLARLLWDDDNLYIAFECEDADIQATKTGRDHRLFEEDVVNITLGLATQGEVIDIEINPLNAFSDTYYAGRWQDEEVDRDWDAVGIQTGVHVRGTISDSEDRDQKWTVEVAVPWQLFESFDQRSRPLPPTDGDLWRLGLFRVERSATEGAFEAQAWSPTKTLSTGWPERFGAVLFSTATVAFERPVLTLQGFQLGGLSGAARHRDLSASGGEQTLRLVLRNHAPRATGMVTALLRSENPLVAVLDSLVNIGTIDGETEVLTDAFRVQVGDGYTAQRPLPMLLLLKDNDGRRWIESLDLYLDGIEDRPYTLGDIEGEKKITLVKKWRYHAATTSYGPSHTTTIASGSWSTRCCYPAACLRMVGRAAVGSACASPSTPPCGMCPWPLSTCRQAHLKSI